VAAVLHAVWNALAHAVADRLVGFTSIGLTYVVVGGIAVLVLGLPPAAAWPSVTASAVLHVVYTQLRWLSYQVCSVWPSTAAASRVRRCLRLTLPALGAAAATGIAIAGYTVIDAAAVSATPAPVYAAWLFFLQRHVLPVIALARRGRELGLTRPVLLAGLGGGLVSIAAYGLVLVAHTSGATAAVAALRETSIVTGALIGAFFLGERLGARRAVAAAVVGAGSVLVGL
jgi:hypothetical protein